VPHPLPAAPSTLLLSCPFPKFNLLRRACTLRMERGCRTPNSFRTVADDDKEDDDRDDVCVTEARVRLFGLRPASRKLRMQIEWKSFYLMHGVVTDY
jgi:hypothetical protein